MKKTCLTVATIGAVFLSGCTDDPLKTVQKTVLPTYDTSVAIGKVLDTYSTCRAKTQKWTTFKGDRDQQFVEFSCVDEEFPKFMQKQVKALLGVFSNHPIIPESATKDLDSIVNWATWMLEFGQALLGAGVLDDQIKEIDKLKSIDITDSVLKVRFAKNLKTDQYEPHFVGYDVTYGDSTRSVVKLPNFVLEACYKNQPIMNTVEAHKADISDALIEAYKKVHETKPAQR